jgi:hypothetical protein
MRNFNVNFAAELAKEFLHMFYLVKIVLPVSGTKYYADFDVPVTYGGNVYISKNFTFQDIVLSSQMSVDSVGIEFDDVDGTISQLALTEDIRGAVVTMYVGVKLLIRGETLLEEPSLVTLITEDGSTLITEVSATTETVLCEEIFRGLIGEWRSKERMFTMTVVNEFILWQKRSLRLCQATCAWVFNKPPYTNLVTNGGFDSDAAGWTVVDCTLASIAGGQSGNCLELTMTGGTIQYTYRAASTNVGKLYRLLGYVQSGTSGNGAYEISVYDIPTGTTFASTNGTSSGAWVQFSFNFTAIGSSALVTLAKINATAGTMLFDTVELYEVTECAYIGSETWCDQSYDRCLVLGNQLNFGGFRYLPACCEQELWWGKAPGIGLS